MSPCNTLPLDIMADFIASVMKSVEDKVTWLMKATLKGFSNILKFCAHVIEILSLFIANLWKILYTFYS